MFCAPFWVPWAPTFRRTCLFFARLACFCCVCCPPSHPTPIHKGGGLRPPPQRGAAAFGGRPPLWIPLWMGVGWLGGQQTRQKHASLAKNKQVRRKVGAQGTQKGADRAPKGGGPLMEEGWAQVVSRPMFPFIYYIYTYYWFCLFFVQPYTTVNAN